MEYKELEEEPFEEEEDEEDNNLPVNGSPIYPHIYVGQSGIPDMTDFNESGYKGDNYVLWNEIFPDIAASSIYG